MRFTSSDSAYIGLAALAGALGGFSGGVAKWAGLCSHALGKAGLYVSVGVCNASTPFHIPLLIDDLESVNGVAPPFISWSATWTHTGMMTLYTTALTRLSSVLVTSISTAANVLVTGALSIFFFNGTLAWTWWLGVLFTVAGTVCLCLAGTPDSSQQPGQVTADRDTKRQKEL